MDKTSIKWDPVWGKAPTSVGYDDREHTAKENSTYA
jgi:hypothetical protein